jgi:uncharacterized protein (TIGR03437 family)
MAVFVGAMASAQTTTQTTLTVTNAAVTLGTNLTATGPATLSGIGSGTFNVSVPVSSLSLTSANASVPYTITLTGGSNSITGTLTIPASLFLGSTSSGSGSATVTGGTGTYANATGSFPSLTGTSTGSILSSPPNLAVSFSGSGTITTGGSSTGGGSVPTVTAIQNNYSYLVAGLPNYGIAPGSLFIVKGTNLNSQPLTSLPNLQTNPTLPLAQNGTSVTVTVAGSTVQPAIYYTSPTQLGLVLPSNTPTGNGTLTVINGTLNSTAVTIQVVPSAFGFDTLFGTGTGAAVATLGATVLSTTSSAAPGQTITLWGSGLGADTANSDRVYPAQTDNLTNVPIQVYIGGVSAQVSYRGRSQYPGLDQINVAIPPTVSTGCNVSVVAVTGPANGVATMSSNFVTIPIAAGGGTCSDSTFGVSGSTIQTLSGKSTLDFGYLGLLQSTAPGTGASSAPVTTQMAEGVFESVSGANFAATTSSGYASLGSCVVNAATTTPSGTIPSIVGLDAGTITVTGPNGSQTLTTIPGVLGIYAASSLPSGFIPAAGGQFTFKGNGGQGVGNFSTSVNFVNPLTWTNSGSAATITRSQGATVNWSGGASGTYVEISGSSAATIGGQYLSVGFVCNAPAGAGTFTVPAYVLQALPVGTGTFTVENSTNPQAFTASFGLDFGFIFAATETQINAAYN